MKNLKIVLTTLIVALALSSFSQGPSPYPTFKFANPIIISGTSDTLQFEVWMKCDVGTTYHTDIFIAFNYNTAAFGLNIFGAGKFFVEKLGLTASELVPGVPYYNILGPNDNQPGRVAFGTEPNLGYNSTLLTLVPVTYTPFMKVKMVIADDTKLAGINFEETLMDGGQLYVLAGGSEPIEYGVSDYDAIDFTDLPLSPSLLLFSEIGDPSNTTTNFVEIYNAGTSTVDFDNFYDWYFNVDGASSLQLTGTLAAGAKYTIAYDNVDFTPTVVSTIVGTGGTSQYLLSIYGDYSTGTAVDVYDGSVIAFTGKHAVRHYNIVSPNATFTAAEWVVSPAEDIDMTAGSHRATLNWDGSTDSEWRDQSNWAEGFIPDAGHNVAITNIGTAPQIDNADFDNVSCQDLTIAGDANLTILSDVTDGDGSIITYGTVTGNASVQRYLGADRYWYVSQPVTAATANVFLHIWMYTYNETASAWDPFIEDETTPLNVMQGYAVWTSSINPWGEGIDPVGNTTVAYDGILNTGAISTPLTFNGDGWNFTGNPYPSAVNWEATGWTKAGLASDAYSVWEGSTYGTYTTGSGGTNGATQYIPAAQGFFVQANAAGTLSVTDAVRTHSTQAFWKADENMLNRLSMTISNGEVDDETVIYFNENATTGLDYNYDAHKLMAVATPQAYTMLADEMMAINTYNDLAQTPSVILGVNAPFEGDYTITASNIESFDASTPIFLQDIVAGQIINLREVSSYTFNAGEGTAERFIVHFTQPQGIGDPSNSEVNNIYAVDHNIYVDFNSVKGEISIYNILGREISRSTAKNGLNIVSVPQGNAVYIVKVISDNAAVTKKVFVK